MLIDKLKDDVNEIHNNKVKKTHVIIVILVIVFAFILWNSTYDTERNMNKCSELGVHGCAICGNTNIIYKNSIVKTENGKAFVYSLYCDKCGRGTPLFTNTEDLVNYWNNNSDIVYEYVLDVTDDKEEIKNEVIEDESDLTMTERRIMFIYQQEGWNYETDYYKDDLLD